MSARPAALLLCAAFACGETTEQIQNRISERLQQQLTSSDKKHPEEPDRLPPELVGNKLGLYVDCIQATRVPLYAGFRQAGHAFARKDRAAVDPVAPEAIERCEKAEREGPLLQPPLPRLEQAGAAYHAAARAFVAELDAVRADLAQKTSTIDKDGEAAPLHAKFTAAYKAWDEARRALDEQIDGHQADIDKQLLAGVEARAGKGLEWHSRSVVIAAKPYVRCLGDHDEFTAGVCDSFLAGFTAAHAAFRAAYEADPAAAEKVFWLSQLAESLREYAAAADALAAAIRGGTAKAGDIAGVVREYGDVVRDAGSLNFAAAEAAADK